MRYLIIPDAGAWSRLLDRLRGLMSGAEQDLLDLLVVVAVILVGWGIAWLAARLLTLVLRSARFNEAVRHAVPGWSTDTAHEPAGLAAWAVFWVVIVAAVVLALDAVGWGMGSSVTDRLRDVVPRVVASALLLLVGVVLSVLLGVVARRFFAGAGLRGARVSGQVVTAVFAFFAVVLALEQLGFAAQLVMGLGITVFASVGLALGLAFGLGCRDLARDLVVEYLRSLDEERPRRPS